MISRSSQVYRVIPDNGPKIKESLSKIQNRDTFPKIKDLKIDEKTGDIYGEIHVRKFHHDETFTTFSYDFVFKIKRKKLYLLGSAKARSLAISSLNRTINEKSNSISDLKFTNKGIVVTLFNKIKTGSPGNFIKRIDLTFGIAGIKYHNKTPLHKMAYQLIDNTCASTHIDFEKFTDGASWIKTTFGIWNLSHLERDTEKDNPASLEVSMDYSFRLFADTTQPEWLELLDKLV